MTELYIHHGDIFDVQANCLVCSANVFLTLSGGVGGELLRRFGDPVQSPLEDYLRRRGLRFTQRGDVVSTKPTGTPYRRILHAVAVDGMYDSTPQVVADVVKQALQMAAATGCRSIVFPALATGYGHLSFEAFLAGWCTGVWDIPAELSRVTLALRDANRALTARARINQANPRKTTRPDPDILNEPGTAP